MALFRKFPYTNFHDLNLDWIIRKLKEFDIKIKNVVTSVNGSHGDVIIPVPDAFNGSPAALGASAPGVSQTYARGDHVHPMPDADDVGAVPAPSVQGSNGNVLSLDASLNPVWTAPGGGGSAPDPYDSTPAALGTASPGVSDDYARGDHVHEKPTYTASDVGAAPAVTEVTVSSAGAVTQALDAGKIYHFTGALTSLTITLNAAGAGIIPQYHFDFDSGSTAPTVTLPGTVTMQGGTFTPEASKHYEIDILNGYGVYVAW